MASFSRLVVHDKLGTGVSDPVDHVPTLEDRGAELRTVIEAAGLRQPTVMGLSEGGPAAIMLAATRPDLVSRLVLFGTFPVGLAVMVSDDFEERARRAGQDPQDSVGLQAKLEASLELITAVDEEWGNGRALAVLSPSFGNTADGRRALARYERCSASPAMAKAALNGAMGLDILDVLPTIDVPALVAHATGDVIPIEGGRLIADLLPEAELMELPGDDHYPWLNPRAGELLDRLQEFMTGTQVARTVQRRVATVLFTDIVGSTERASRLGDEVWRDLLVRHDDLVRSAVEAHDGTYVKSLGDGALCVFDGPAAAIRCSAALHERAADLTLELRVGIHTGEVELRDADVAGIGVHIAARVVARAVAGETWVSRTVKDLVIGSSYNFDRRGEHELAGLPGRWELHAVSTGPGEVVRIPSVAETMTVSDRAATAFARRNPRASRRALAATPAFRQYRGVNRLAPDPRGR